MAEKKTAEIVIESEREDDILKNFGEPERTPAKKKTASNIKILSATLICAAVLCVVILLIVFIPKNSGDEIDPYASASVSSVLDGDNVWQANVEKDKDGNIKKNGSGQLLAMVPADIEKIELENENGSITIKSCTPTVTTEETDPKTGEKVEGSDTTQYTVVGFEDFELQSGAPDEIASACSSLSFISVSCADASDKLKDFGFDMPRAAAKVTYNDKTTAVITVGSEAPKGLGTYVMFGSTRTVYLCDTEIAQHLLCGINDLISLTINSSADNVESAEFKSVALKGSNFGETVVIKPNTDEEIDSDYVITSPYRIYAANSEASKIAGGIRGLYAESVAAVNPSKTQLSELGLGKPYAELEAVYPDIEVKLIASKPDSEGNCLLMEKGGRSVYRISAEKIAWVSSSPDELISEYLLSVDLKSLKKMTVNNIGFNIETKKVNTADDEGEVSSTTRTTVKSNGKKIDEANFETFFSNASLLTKREKTVSDPSGSPKLTIIYSYSTGRSDDTLKFYKTGESYTARLNSKTVGTVNSSYVEKLMLQAEAVSKNDSVKSFW